MSEWPSLSYEGWSATCDTLHAHTQVLGKLAVELAPPEPQLQHAALRLSARGWETLALPAPDGSGAIVAALDLRTHEAVVEHSGGRETRIPLTPNRPVAEVTREVLEAVGRLGGAVEINPTPQEVPWEVPLDEDHEHASYDADQVATYFVAATAAAQVLAAFRAPFGDARHRSTRGGVRSTSRYTSTRVCRPIPRPTTSSCATLEMRSRSRSAGGRGIRSTAGRPSSPFAYPTPDGFAGADLSPAAARWDAELGEYVLDWDDVRESPDPHAVGARVRSLRLQPRLQGVRLGSRPRRDRQGHPAAGRLRALDRAA